MPPNNSRDPGKMSIVKFKLENESATEDSFVTLFGVESFCLRFVALLWLFTLFSLWLSGHLTISHSLRCLPTSTFFNKFTSSGNATSTIKQFCSFWFRIIKSGLFVGIILSVNTVLSHIKIHYVLSSIFVTFFRLMHIIFSCHWEIKTFANSPVYVACHLVVPLQVLHWCKVFTSNNYVTDLSF